MPPATFTPRLSKNCFAFRIVSLVVVGSLGRRALVTQITLILSAVMTVWLAYQTSLGPLFYFNDSLWQRRRSARLAHPNHDQRLRQRRPHRRGLLVYYFVGCISGPIWTLVVGYVMQQYGFTPAFLVAASTYLAGMLLLTFVKEEPKPAKA